MVARVIMVKCKLCWREPYFDGEEDKWVTIMIDRIPKKLCRQCVYKVAKRVIDDF